MQGYDYANKFVHTFAACQAKIFTKYSEDRNLFNESNPRECLLGHVNDLLEFFHTHLNLDDQYLTEKYNAKIQTALFNQLDECFIAHYLAMVESTKKGGNYLAGLSDMLYQLAPSSSSPNLNKSSGSGAAAASSRRDSSQSLIPYLNSSTADSQEKFLLALLELISFRHSLGIPPSPALITIQEKLEATGSPSLNLIADYLSELKQRLGEAKGRKIESRGKLTLDVKLKELDRKFVVDVELKSLVDILPR